MLDGFDIGVGIVHLILGRSAAERHVLLHSIAPVWDGNEVWLIASGALLFLAFPAAYASAFSGFYLPLMVLLWLLILRGIAVEFRGFIASPVWYPFWDVIFSGASALLAIFFGAALANIVRGVPLDREGFFFLPLWTDLRISANPGVLDWFTILFGLASLVSLALHGTLWVALKCDGDLQLRARKIASTVWWAVLALVTATVVVTPLVQAHVARRFAARGWGLVFPLLALSGLIAIKTTNGGGRARAAFVSSCVYVAAILMSAAFGLYPYLLPSITDPGAGLTIFNSAADHYALTVALMWLVPGLALAATYFAFVYRNYPRDLEVGADRH